MNEVEREQTAHVQPNVKLDLGLSLLRSLCLILVLSNVLVISLLPRTCFVTVDENPCAILHPRCIKNGNSSNMLSANVHSEGEPRTPLGISFGFILLPVVGNYQTCNMLKL